MGQASDIAVEQCLRALSLRRPSPALCYIIFSTMLMGLWVGYYIFNPFGFDEPSRDTWHHVAVLRELMAAPFAPANPHIPTDEPSRYFTPVTVLAALLGKLLGLSPYQLFGCMGAASCVGLVLGCWIFAQRYYASQWAPLILLLALLFLWGIPMGHAGLHTYATLLSSAAYPSTITVVMGLLAWAFAFQVLKSGRAGVARLGMLGVLTAVILLTHQLSGAIILVGMGSFILFYDDSGVRIRTLLLSAMALGCLSTLAWPYFQIIDIVSSVSDARWRSANEGANRVSTAVVLIAPSLLGVAGFRRANGSLRWELLFPAVFFCFSYIFLTIQDSAIAHRLPPAIILFNQLGFVWLVLAYVQGRVGSPGIRPAIMAMAFILVVWLAITSGSARLHDLDRRASEGSMLSLTEAMAGLMPEGSIAFATENIVFPLQSTGRRVVSIPRPEPAATSLNERQRATDRFFNIGISRAERARLITRWGATHIVFSSADLEPEIQRQLRLLGPAVRLSHGVELITIDQARAYAQKALP